MYCSSVFRQLFVHIYITHNNAKKFGSSSYHHKSQRCISKKKLIDHLVLCIQHIVLQVTAVKYIKEVFSKCYIKLQFNISNKTSPGTGMFMEVNNLIHQIINTV